MVAFMQYISLPFVITLQILMLIRGTFSPEFASEAWSWYSIHWGAFSDLYLDLLGVLLIYLLASSTFFWGIKVYKKVTNISGIVKWFTAGFLVVAGISLALSQGSTNWHYWVNNSTLNFNGFMNSFISCFFFFAGFELFATAGKNINNPEKNIGKRITLIVLICTIFYIVISVIFFAVYSQFQQNMNMGSWLSFNNKIILYGGPIIMIISGLALKINLGMQNSLYGGTVLQPLSKEGYISDKLFILNKDGLPMKAILLNLWITVIMIFCWLIIPDLIKGFWLTNHPGKTYHSALDVSSLTSASSVITTFIYMMVVLTTLKLTFIRKLKLKVWELLLFIMVFFFLGLILFWHYYSLIRDTVAQLRTNPDDTSPLVGMIVEFVFIIATITFALLWYKFYYLPKYEKRLVNKPHIQERLNQDFVLNIEHLVTFNQE